MSVDCVAAGGFCGLFFGCKIVFTQMLYWIYETSQLSLLIQWESFRTDPDLFLLLIKIPAHIWFFFRFEALGIAFYTLQ